MAALVVVIIASQFTFFAGAALATTPPEAFDNVWNTTDAAVAGGTAGYSWFWGPTANDERAEAYQDSPGGEREVRYYDKSRMEITHPDGDPDSIWFVTNGLLTVELVTGEQQVGDDAFEVRSPAHVRVAGDPQDNPGTPTYAEFAPYVTTDGASNRAGDRTGQAVTEHLSGDGVLSQGVAAGITLANYQAATGHNIASVFWDWANDPNSGLRPSAGVDWLYVLGYPITEPYWIDATVAGTTRPVLVQLFQRRVLTYDAGNPAAYRVEFGNIGLHYHEWLYGGSQPPTEGGVLYDWSLSDWPDQDFTSGDAFAQDGTYHHRVDPDPSGATAPAAFSYLPDFDRGDLSASIRLKLDTPDSQISEACLMLRLAADLGHDYAFCLNGLGETTAIFEDNSGDESIIDTLLDYDVRDGTNPATDWNELKIMAEGNHFWFMVNGALVGDAQHDGPVGGGSVGFYVINFDTDVVEYEWDALMVHALQ